MLAILNGTQPTATSSNSTKMPLPNRSIRKLLLSVLLIQWFPAAWSEPAGAPPEIRHVRNAGSPIFQQYFQALIQTILDHSVDRFGPFRLTEETREMTPQRSLMGLHKGEWDSLVNTDLSQLFVADKDVEIISGPFLQTLIGLRRCIVRTGDLPRFEAVRSLEQLRQFSVGQGVHWTEVEIYRNAGLQVSTAEAYANLFPMLSSKRFDFLPLSYLEARPALTQPEAHGYDLSIAEGLYVFYPMPVNIVVSKRDPDLVDRFNYGAAQAFASGAIDQLVRQYFPQLEHLHIDDRQVIYLPNHLLSEKSSRVITNHFKSLFVKPGA